MEQENVCIPPAPPTPPPPEYNDETLASLFPPAKSLTFHLCVATMRTTVQNQTQLTRTGEEDDVFFSSSSPSLPFPSPYAPSSFFFFFFHIEEIKKKKKGKKVSGDEGKRGRGEPDGLLSPRGRHSWSVWRTKIRSRRSLKEVNPTHSESLFKRCHAARRQESRDATK